MHIQSSSTGNKTRTSRSLLGREFYNPNTTAGRVLILVPTNWMSNIDVGAKFKQCLPHITSEVMSHWWIFLNWKIKYTYAASSTLSLPSPPPTSPKSLVGLHASGLRGTTGERLQSLMPFLQTISFFLANSAIFSPALFARDTSSDRGACAAAALGVWWQHATRVLLPGLVQLLLLNPL